MGCVIQLFKGSKAIADMFTTHITVDFLISL